MWQKAEIAEINSFEILFNNNMIERNIAINCI